MDGTSAGEPPEEGQGGQIFAPRIKISIGRVELEEETRGEAKSNCHYNIKFKSRDNPGGWRLEVGWSGSFTSFFIKQLSHISDVFHTQHTSKVCLSLSVF